MRMSIQQYMVFTWTFIRQYLFFTSYLLGHYEQDCHLLVMCCCWIQMVQHLMWIQAPDPPVWNESELETACLWYAFKFKLLNIWYKSFNKKWRS